MIESDWLIGLHALVCAVVWAFNEILPKLVTLGRFLIAYLLCIQGKEYKHWLENDAPSSDVSSSELVPIR